MPDRKPDPQKPGADPLPPNGAHDPAPKPARPAPFAGIKPWIPLLITILAMPPLAYATTTFLIIPKINLALRSNNSSLSSNTNDPNSTSADNTSQKTKHSVSLSKMIVNVAGTQGTRYLLCSLTLVGLSPDFKSHVETHRDQLLDLATTSLAVKTIADLEKPGARNQLRSELLTIFNSALGDKSVHELFITEFAIQ